MAPQSVNAKNLSDHVEFDAEYWLVVIAHNNQPLDSSSGTVHILTGHSCKCWRLAHLSSSFLTSSWSSFLPCTTRSCCCYRLANKGHSVAPLWPRLTARLQRSAGGRLLSVRSWSTHLLHGRPGRRCHWLLGGRPSDRLRWQLSALWTGTSSGSLATWPKRLTGKIICEMWRARS